MNLVYLLIERLLEARCSLLVETPFDPDWANPRFKALQARHSFQPAQVVLSARLDLLRQRYARRVDNGERHPGHMDRLRMGQYDTVELERRNRPLDLDGPVFHVDTSSFASLDFDSLIGQLRTLRGI